MLKAQDLTITIKAEFLPASEETDGPGIYHFVGKRYLPARNGFVSTNDLVEVISVKDGPFNDRDRLYVQFFGRGPRFPIYSFDGLWRKLVYDFNGERRK